MKRYRLLRDNKEFGPFFPGELTSFGLYASDLVWIEEDSTRWAFSDDIPELRALAKERPPKPAVDSKKAAAENGTPKQNVPLYATTAGSADEAALLKNESTTGDYLSLTKERIEWHAKPKKFNLTAITANLFGLGVLLVGVMMGAFVVKKIMDHFEFEPSIESAKALEIKSESLPASTSDYAAKATFPSLPEPVNPVPVAAVETGQEKSDQPKFANVPALKTTAARAVPTPETALVSAVLKEEKQESEESQLVVEEKEETFKPTEAPKKAPTLDLSANEYKVGMFGGISGLEIFVNNPSSTPVSKALVEVEFLKPNGNVVKTQTLSVENISPGSTKKIAVPSSNRGVSVRYKIIGIDV